MLRLRYADLKKWVRPARTAYHGVGTVKCVTTELCIRRDTLNRFFLHFVAITRQASTHDIITLRVKSEDGDHTYIVKMCLSETVADLRKYLDKHR